MSNMQYDYDDFMTLVLLAKLRLKLLKYVVEL